MSKYFIKNQPVTEGKIVYPEIRNFKIQYFIKRIKRQKKNYRKIFKLLKENPVKINDLEKAKLLLYEYIRDGYKATLEDIDESELIPGCVYPYYKLINIVEVAFEQTALTHIPDKQNIHPLLCMSGNCYMHLDYLYQINKQSHFEFAVKLGSVYLFLLDLWYERLIDKKIYL